MAALLIVGLLPANALANTSREDSAQKINAYFKTVLVGEDGKESEQRIDDGPVRYNNTNGFWATLGSFETTLGAPDGSYQEGSDKFSTAVKEFGEACKSTGKLDISNEDKVNLAFVPDVNWKELKK